MSARRRRAERSARRRGVMLLFVLGLIAALIPVTALPAVADHDGGADPDPDPIGVSFTLEGCRQESLPAGYDIEGNGFLCDVGTGVDGYTTGNLGKEWNELDLVPWRVTADAGNSAPSTQTYTISFVVDHEDAGAPGYDVITTPTLNAALSDASCAISFSGEQTLSPGFGGTDVSLYRYLTITQDQNTTCVIDGQARLAVGSHLYPGSSLHMNLGNHELATSGIGNKDVSIPVNEILPQELNKDMTATQDADHIWNITKAPTPAQLDFGCTCEDGALFELPVTIRVEWDKLPATPGMVTVVTNVYATNPAARAITVNVTDEIYGDVGGGNVLLDTANSGDVVVPKNTTQLVLTHSFDAPANVTGLNDIATASYIDTVTGVPVPGQTTATASTDIQPGSITNASATITDVESITGTGLSYSVDSTTGATGAFQDGYVAGTETTGSVTWVSDTQTDDGFVEFNKTVYLDEPRSASGTLSDTATLNAVDGFTTDASAQVGISSSALVDLTIDKTIPDILQGAETASFDFRVTGLGGYDVIHTIGFVAGETTNSITIEGLEPGTYNVNEQEQIGWVDPDGAAGRDVVIDLPTCSGSESYDNDIVPANARVNKITVPVDFEDGWEFTLNGPGGGETVTTVGGTATFTTDLQEGDYTISETPQAGWDLTDVTDPLNDDGDLVCEFSVDYPGDAGATFTCAFENTKRGNIIVEKVTDPAGSTQAFAFSTDYGADFDLADGQTNDSGLLVPGTYAVSETVPAGWDLISATCDDGSDPASIGLDPGETVTCTFTNQQDANIIVQKETDPDGSTQVFSFTSDYGPDFSLSDGQSNDSGDLDPGTYAVSETVPAGWELESASCDDGSDPLSIDLSAGETVTCTFNNQQDAFIIVEKQTDPDGSPQLFDFTTSYGDPFQLSDGQTNNSGDLDPGTYVVSETVPDGWDLTSATCDDGSVPSSIGLSAGETVKCTFNNQQDANIIVKKVTDPAGSAQAFTFTTSYSADFDLTDGQQNDSGDLDPGTYSVTELTPAGWTLTSATCSDGSDPSSIDLEAGETVTCTFTNTIDRGNIVVKKVTDPTGASASFGFTTNYGAGFSLGDGGMNDSGPLLPSSEAGTYSVAETGLPDGWSLTSATCDDGSDPLAIDLQPNETVTCTFTNTIERGNIIVQKETDPDGSNQLFTFQTSYSADFQLSDGQSNDSGPLVPTSEAGTYSVAEVVPPGWELKSASCNDGSPIGAIDLGPGETVTCTFFNEQDAEIRVEKTTLPGGSPQVFTFTATYGDFELTDADPPNNSGDLDPGTYVISETVPDGWELVFAECDDGTLWDANGDITIDLAAGEIVNCTFTNRQDGRIIVVKETDPGGSQELFDFTSDYGAPFQLSDGQSNDSGLLTPGTYSVSETVPAGWDLVSATCDDDSDPASIGLDPGEVVTCTFVNQEDAYLIVEKQTDPDGSTQLFTFSTDYSADFQLSDGQTDNSGDLDPGTYAVSEAVPAGWDLISATCDNGDDPAAVTIAAGDTVTCTFTNRERGMVTLLKLTDGDPNSTMAWSFTLTGPEVDAGHTTPPTTTDFGGAKLIPGEEYTLCETGIPAGWTLEWQVDTDGDGVPDTIIPMVAGVNNSPVDPVTGYSQVYDPNYVAPPGTYTNDTRCVNFAVQSGQTLAFQIDNRFPGGEPRTIGYWKNWNTCTNGNQAATAAANGGPDEGWFILDDLLNDPGYTIGVLRLDGADCEDAVNILDKRSIDDGKKRASDGAYNLASQLLAAQLNLSAGAETCQEAVDAVNAGQTLLAGIGFDGTGSYLKGKKAGEANAIAATLDEYNNGNLCTP